VAVLGCSCLFLGLAVDISSVRSNLVLKKSTEYAIKGKNYEQLKVQLLNYMVQNA
jgi:hypothetical protein